MHSRSLSLSRYLAGVALAGACAVATPQADAAVLKVCKHGCTFSTIQGAVDDAASGDVIDVGPGTYFENVRIDRISLTLIGTGADLTTVDGQFRGSVFTLGLGTFGGNATPRVSLIGMTITHGQAPSGGGILVSAAVLDLESSVVASNRATEDGGGIEIDSPGISTSRIVNSTIVHNRCRGSGGGIQIGPEANLSLINSTISRNSASSRGGGLHAHGASHTMIVGSNFTDNSAGDGGAIYREGGLPSASLTISKSAIAGNVALSDGGGVFVAVGFHVLPLAIDHSTIARNVAGRDGGGFIGSASLDTVVVVQNTAKRLGGGILGGVQVVKNSVIIAQNTPTDCVGDSGDPCP